MLKDQENPDKSLSSESEKKPFRRIELDSYSTEEMDLYLFFQNHGKYPTSTPLT